jgi:hypothetical protein
MSITIFCRMFPISLQGGCYRDVTDMVCRLYDLV